MQDQSLLFLDMSVGYWVYRAQNAPFLKGVAPMVELHYTTTLQSPDEAPAGDFGGRSPRMKSTRSPIPRGGKTS